MTRQETTIEAIVAGMIDFLKLYPNKYTAAVDFIFGVDGQPYQLVLLRAGSVDIDHPISRFPDAPEIS